MKKSKFLAVIAMVMLMSTLLTACSVGAVKTMDLEDAIDPKAAYTVDSPEPTNMEIISGLTDAMFYASSGILTHFVAEIEEEAGEFDKHIIYNAKSNRIIANFPESETSDITVTLGRNYQSETGYYTIQTKFWDVDNYGYTVSGTDRYETVLYSQTGKRIASVNYKASAANVADLVCFDNVCYKADKNGAFSEAFKLSPLAKTPSLVKHGDYYYSFNETAAVIVYNSAFEFVSRCNLPTYAEFSDDTSLILDNGDIFLQYHYELDEYATEYSYIDAANLKKYQLVTLIIDYKKGSAKEIDCTCFIDGTEMTDADELAEHGISSEFTTYVHAVQIENQRLGNDDYSFIGTVDNSGKITAIEGINGGYVQGISMVAANRWWVRTDAGHYLINGEGDVIGDITNARNVGGKYLTANGKMYDFSLNLLFDSTAKNLTEYTTIGNSIIYKNSDGEYLLYTGGTTTTTIITKDDINKGKKEYVGTVSGGFVIKVMGDYEDNTKYEVYNASGKKLLTVSSQTLGYVYGNPFTYVTGNSTEGYAIVSTYNRDGKIVYYSIRA